MELIDPFHNLLYMSAPHFQDQPLISAIEARKRLSREVAATKKNETENHRLPATFFFFPPALPALPGCRACGTLSLLLLCDGWVAGPIAAVYVLFVLLVQIPSPLYPFLSRTKGTI